MTEKRSSEAGGIPSDRDRRQVRYLALASVAILVTVGTMRMTLPQLAPRVNVRWAPGVSEEHRAELERSFHLVSPAYVEGSTWTYDLADLSPATVTALVRHPSIEDTHGINRQAGVVEVDAPLGTTRTGPYPFGPWVATEPVAWVGLCSGWAVVLSGAWLALNRHNARRGTSPNTPASTRLSD